MPPDRLRPLVLAEKARRSFRSFVTQAWPIVDPAHPLIDAWHLDAICLHLQEVARGGIRRLIINIPPGFGKSMLVCVLWPAWMWTHRPAWRALFSSHAAPLALRDSVRCRALVESEWYVDAFSRPSGWSLSSDQNVKSRFTNTATGDRMAIGAGAGATGFRGDAFVVDDPLSAMGAYSKNERDEITRWWDEETSQRLDQPLLAARVVVQQRLHEEDLAGHLIDGGGYEVLSLPSEFEPERRATTFHIVRNGHEAREPFWQDPRTEPGELLCPALRSADAIALAKHDLQGGYAGQHQQRPTPAGGGMFRAEWWRFWKPDGRAPDCVGQRPRGCSDAPARPLPERFVEILVSVDANFKDRAGADPVSILVIMFAGADRYVLDRVHGPLGFTKTVQQLVAVCARWPRARRKLIEDKANGSAIIETLKTEIPGIIAVEPQGGKEARAWAIQPQVQAGNVFLPDGAPWLQEFVEEFSAFPLGRHDDDVDALSQALSDNDGAGRYRAGMMALFHPTGGGA